MHLALAVAVTPAVAGLDHVPIAAADLEAAAAYRRLGFVLQPGRAHDNGIAAAKRTLARIPFREGAGSIFVPPESAPGLWIALRE